MRTKVYVVMKTDRAGSSQGLPLAVKLTRGAAQAVAKRHAPSRVELYLADKTDRADSPDIISIQGGSKDGTDRNNEV